MAPLLPLRLGSRGILTSLIDLAEQTGGPQRLFMSHLTQRLEIWSLIQFNIRLDIQAVRATTHICEVALF
jgi:hypothetical protein